MSVHGLVCAAAVTGLIVAPFALWGNPYDPAVLGYWRTGLWITTAVLLAAAVHPQWLFDVLEAAARAVARPSPLVFALALGGVIVVLAVLVSTVVLQRAASTADEVAQLWHARILVHGRLALPPDPNPEFFAVDNVIDVGRWYSHFPIGGPLVLALGVLAGVPYLVGPVLAGASGALLYQFARRAFGELFGRATAIVFAVAPMVLFMSATYMNHVPTLFLTIAALAATEKWARSTAPLSRMVAANVIGLAIGGIATIRPLDAIVVAAAIGVAQIGCVVKERGRILDIAVQTLAAVAAVSVLLVANWRTNGGPFVFGYDIMWGAGHRVGFHANPNGQVHTVTQGIEYIVTYVGELNYMLLAWPVPVMLVIVVGIACLRRGSRWSVALLILFFGQMLAYGAYWGVGELFGPRFLYTAIPAMLVFVVRVPFAVGERLGRRGALTTALLFAVWSIGAWTIPGLAGNARGLAHQARGQRLSLKFDAASVAADAGIHNAVVFVREPASQRLLRRLWGLGISRSDALALLANNDACSLLTAVAAAESAPTKPADSAEEVAKAATPLPTTGAIRLAADPQIRLVSPASVTAACRAELDPPGFVPLSFGAAFVSEPIDKDGRIDGDVIYLADLGQHNAVLRRRFGTRAWYRLVATAAGFGRLDVRVVPYTEVP